MDSFKNYYSILNVSETAPHDEIKAAFRKMARLYAPNVNPDPLRNPSFRGDPRSLGGAGRCRGPQGIRPEPGGLEPYGGQPSIFCLEGARCDAFLSASARRSPRSGEGRAGEGPRPRSPQAGFP